MEGGGCAIKAEGGCRGGGTYGGTYGAAFEGGGGDPLRVEWGEWDRIKQQTNANQRQCTPQQGRSASLFSMPNVEWGQGCTGKGGDPPPPHLQGAQPLSP